MPLKFGCGHWEYEAALAPPFSMYVAESGPAPRPGTAELFLWSLRSSNSRSIGRLTLAKKARHPSYGLRRLHSLFLTREKGREKRREKKKEKKKEKRKEKKKEKKKGEEKGEEKGEGKGRRKKWRGGRGEKKEKKKEEHKQMRMTWRYEYTSVCFFESLGLGKKWVCQDCVFDLVYKVRSVHEEVGWFWCNGRRPSLGPQLVPAARTSHSFHVGRRWWKPVTGVPLYRLAAPARARRPIRNQRQAAASELQPPSIANTCRAIRRQTRASPCGWELFLTTT